MSVGSDQPSREIPSELRAQITKFRELRERGERVRQELAATEATVRGASGAVSVTVGAGGVLRALELGASSRTLSPAQLSQEIMRTYAQAGRQAAERSVSIVSDLVGVDSPTLQLLRDAVPPEPEAERSEG